MFIDVIKVIVLVVMGVVGVGALTAGLITQSNGVEAGVMTFGGLLAYAVAWAGGLYMCHE